MFDRNLAFYFVVPDCPSILVRYLYEACEFNREQKDSYGYTVKDWAKELEVEEDIVQFITQEDVVIDKTDYSETTPSNMSASATQKRTYSHINSSITSITGSNGPTPQERNRILAKLANLNIEQKVHVLDLLHRLSLEEVVAETINDDNNIENGVAIVEPNEGSDFLEVSEESEESGM